MFHREEIRLLYRTVLASRPPGDIAEIGSWKGRSTVVMGLALRDSGDTSCRIYAIDPHIGSEEHRDVIEREGSTLSAFTHNLQTLGVDSLVEPVVEYSTRAASALAARGVSLRLLFIDGAHDEASVRADIRAFLPLVRAGGTIALHDCGPDTGWPGVWAAYRAELAPVVKEVERAHSLLVTQLLEDT